MLTKAIFRSVVAAIVILTTQAVVLAGGPKMFELNNVVGKYKITFVSDAPMEKIVGTAIAVTGTFNLDLAHLEATKGSIVVEVRSMKTAIARRDDSMYGVQWLDAAKYPNITYEITSLKDVKVTKEDGKTLVSATTVGTFSCHGVTKPLTSTITITYLNQTAETKKRAPGDLVMVTANFDVALKDFNVTGKSGLIGSSVGETIAVTASLFANSSN